MKKIISYSLYGEAPLYLQGAVRNAELCPAVFPGWTCRFYCSQEIPESLITRLSDLGAEIVRRDRGDTIDGMFWRFEPAGEPGIEAMIVRDTDSRLNARDYACVEEWLASGKKFHFVRDHPSQRNAILGGLWGCLGNAVPDMTEKISAWKSKSAKGNDQDFLLYQVYPAASKDCHIQTNFTRFPGESIHPIPCERPHEWEYLGRPVDPAEENSPPSEAEAICISLKRPLRSHKLPLGVKIRKWFS